MAKRTTRVVYNQLSPITLGSTPRNHLINQNVLQQLSSLQQKQQEDNLLISSKLHNKPSNKNVAIPNQNQPNKAEQRVRKGNTEHAHYRLPKLKLRNDQLGTKKEAKKVLNLTEYLIMNQEQKSKSKQQKKQGIKRISVKKYHIIVQQKSGRQKRTKYFRSIVKRNKTDIHGSLERLESGMVVQAQIIEMRKNKGA